MWPFTQSSSYLALINAKRDKRERLLSEAPSYAGNEAKYDPYLKATASKIVANIQNGRWTASQVIEAYSARVAFAHKTTNCATEVLFDQARTQALTLDKHFEATGKVVGPLHGVPISLKDQFEVAGVDHTVGFTRWANKPATEDCPIVATLKEAGGIPIIKTNVPQTMLAFESANPLWGKTLNPHNAAYTSGGSSGGEAALLAMDGAVFGMGSDVGGSLRIPASYCGIYSIKPSAGRNSKLGVAAPAPGFEAIRTVLGPMARSVDDVEIACKVTFGKQDYTYETPPLPYRAIELPPKLRFGFYTSDDYVKASPANKRAVLETVEALRKQGHECVEFSLPQPERAFNIFVALTSADGYKKLLSHLGPDKQEKALFLVTLGPKLFRWIRFIAVWIIANLVKDNLFAGTLREARPKSVYEKDEFVEQKGEFVKFWHKQVWEKYRFDGIIAPVQATPCIPHGGCATMAPIAAATILYNVVESPVGTVPVTHVTAADTLPPDWDSEPGHGSKILEYGLYKEKPVIYDAEKMAGLPVSVQIVGKNWEDEKVIAMMRVVDQALGERGFGPMSWKGQKMVDEA